MSLTTGIKIKKIREFRNYTQEHMSEKLGMSQTAYSRMENGQSRLDIDRLKEISSVLDVPIEAIVSDEGSVFNFNNGHSVYAGQYVTVSDSKEFKLLEDKVKMLEDEIARLQGNRLGQQR